MLSESLKRAEELHWVKKRGFEIVCVERRMSTGLQVKD